MQPGTMICSYQAHRTALVRLTLGDYFLGPFWPMTGMYVLRTPGNIDAMDLPLEALDMDYTITSAFPVPGESQQWFLKLCCYANSTSLSSPPPLQAQSERGPWQRDRKSKNRAEKAREGRGPVCVMHQRSASLPFRLQSLGDAANPRLFVGFCRLVPGTLPTTFPLWVILI
ncbi:uncharacterized protein BO80DRAFT_132182 [Aspergillus ibericus CBS 121593]|uniref:Uncharacterized protein n=1 Tax=Aspergillus ibericus CBS 121593 TaxID=1448316 RepID=A0A395HE42_9EURO|nr:hypothetical protein BO80DRAFT_132182 [Aspergillus ibericus CBS 121593]RAL05258.1 hypothetical protein BO80DRAFT_132182 [Aspergillus ibericus CBS 121593]